MKHLTLSRALLGLLTLGYLIGAAVYFSSIGNAEFMGYIAGVATLLLLVGLTLPWTRIPDWLLWMLSFLMLLHILGGGVKVAGDVLYAYVVFPLENPTGLTFLKFDQLVHAYGAGVAAFFGYFFLGRLGARAGWGMGVGAFLIAMGCGALNEIVELVATLLSPESGVGGYFNNAIDLVANAGGAALAALLAVRYWKKPA
ncbi:MAG TPA: DUF2238 domain-containing protein [Candidatus Paceibacterota bacterium]|nr:DUF2238 domain-containing protein [Candidatus Paceibacterota bacterium]